MNKCDHCRNSETSLCGPECDERGYLSFDPMTNYDIINAKIPEELALFLAELVDCADCPAKMHGCSVSEESCIGTWLYWLRKVAEV